MMTFSEFVLMMEGLLQPDRLPLKGMKQVNLLPSIQTQRRKSHTAAPRPKPLFPMPKLTPPALRVARPPKPAPPGGPPPPPPVG